MTINVFDCSVVHPVASEPAAFGYSPTLRPTTGEIVSQ
jgi:hypothetical protein